MFGTVPKAMYEKLFDVLNTDSGLTYFATCQKGFFPRSGNLLDPTLYPWVFIEFGSYGEVAIYRMPNVWVYDFTISIVMMSLADRGDPTSLVFNDGTNVKKGIADIVADIGVALWVYKPNNFGIAGVNKWDIARVGTPTVLSIQALLVNPFVRGIQMDCVFQIREVT